MLVMTFVLLGAGLGILKLSNLKTVGMGLETIYHDRVKPLKDLKMLSDIYAVTIVGAANRVYSGEFSWAEGNRRLDQAIQKIPILWQEYLDTALTKEEKKSIRRLEGLFEAADKSLMRLRQILLSENREALGKFVRQDLYPCVEPVVRTLDELFQLQVRIVKDINDTEKVRCQLAMSIGMGSIALSFVLFILAILQWRRFRALLNSL